MKSEPVYTLISNYIRFLVKLVKLSGHYKFYNMREKLPFQYGETHMQYVDNYLLSIFSLDLMQYYFQNITS
jgi:hypothetical protein